jgi:hypothetical protein
MPDPSPLTIGALALVALAAGTIDAIAGGGGLSVTPPLSACAVSRNSACSPRRSSSDRHFTSGRCGKSFAAK